MLSLFKQLSSALTAISQLIVVAEPVRRAALLQLYKHIERQLLVLVDKAVDTSRPEYWAASDEINDATKAAKAAIRNSAITAQTIQKFARVSRSLEILAATNDTPSASVSPTRGGGERSVRRDESGAGGGGGAGTGSGGGDGGSGNGGAVARNLVGEMPPMVQVNSPIKLTVTLTARKAKGSNVGGFSLPVGTKVDVIVRADAPLRIVGQCTARFEVQDPQPEVTRTFDLTADALGPGRVEIDAFHNGMPVAALTVTTDIVETLPETLSPAKPKKAQIGVVRRTPPELSLFIFERDDEITFFLQSADGVYNMEDYPPVKLQTPRAYFQEFFRTIENAAADSARDQLRTQGLNLFRTAVPEPLQTTLWNLRDRVRTLQINSDEPWIPWEVCKLEGVVDGNVEEGPFFAEAFNVTRWFRRVAAVPELRLSNIALVVPDDSDLENSQSEKRYIEGLGGSGRNVANIPPTRAGVTAAMQTAQYDAWHFTGHARASVAVDADKSPIELMKPDKLTPADIVGKTSNMLKTKPFVFLNACQSAQSGMSLTGVGGWAKRFIKVQADRPSAAAFIGTYWSVDDGKAFEFAKALYDRLINGIPIGKAAQEARLVVQGQNDPDRPEAYDASWLAYTVYADPSATVV